MFRSLPMSTLLAFESYARNRNLKAAAEELKVSPANIRHHINNLEEWLGTSTFRREGRHVELTDAGQQFFQAVHAGLAEISQCAHQLRPAPDASSVRVEVAPALAAFWLVPRLASFYRHHPDVTLHIGTDNNQVNLNREAAIDVAIRLDICHSTDMTRHTQLPETMGVYGAPDVVASAQHGRVALVALPGQLSPSAANGWAGWCRRAETDWFSDPNQSWRVYSQEALVLQATLAGQGLMLGSSLLVADSVKAGRLVPFRPEVTVPGHNYAVLTAPGRHRHPPVRAFLDWIEHAQSPVEPMDDGAYTLFSL